MTTGTQLVAKIQRLSAGDLEPLAALIDHLALAPHFPGDAVLNGADPVIRSPHHLGEASGMAQLLIGIAGAAMQELGFLETAAEASLPEKDSYPAKMTSIDSVYGKLSFLAPPLAFSNLDLPYESGLTPYGADAPEWQDSMTKALAQSQ
jgi:hypothetical protein